MKTNKISNKTYVIREVDSFEYWLKNEAFGELENNKPMFPSDNILKDVIRDAKIKEEKNKREKSIAKVKIDIKRERSEEGLSGNKVFKVDYMIDEKNGVSRHGQKYICIEDYKSKGKLSDLVLHLIEEYEEELNGGEEISYKGEIK